MSPPGELSELRKHIRCTNPDRELILEGLHGVLAEVISDRSSLQNTAELLCVSPRTLSRRLQQLGTSYREHLADARKAQALHYLKDPNLQIAEISRLLGYQNTSNFIKAFKQWTGDTPRRYRAMENSRTEFDLPIE